ncbi:MAG: hypothetical protein ACKV2Q_32265 [Planctomycetaceae bacterium]
MTGSVSVWWIWGYLDRVEIFCEHVCVATHARATVAEQYMLEPRHYPRARYS